MTRLGTASRAAFIALATALFVSCAEPAPETVSFYHWDFSYDPATPVGQTIARKTGVTIKAISAPWSEWAGKLNSLIAAWDAPDVFVTYGPGDADVFRRLRDEGALMPLSGYLKDYPHVAARLMRWPQQARKGEYFALPVEIRLDHTLLARLDRLEAVGLGVPTTIDEFHAAARALKARYGGYPISSSPAHTAGFFWLYPLFYAYGGAWEDWVSEDGRLLPSWISTGNREALRFINTLYHEGLLDPEFFSNSDADKKEKFLSGKASLVMDGGYPDYARELAKRDPDARLATFGALEGPGGAGMWGMDGYFTAVSINAKLPDAKVRRILALFDYLYSDEGLELLRYGVRGTHYDLEKGVHVPLLPKEGEGYAPLAIVDPSASLRSFVEFDNVHYPEWTPYRSELERIFVEGEKYGRFNRFQYDQTEADQRYGKILYDLTLRHYVDLVRTEDFDSEWALYVAAFNKAGGEAVVTARNQAK